MSELTKIYNSAMSNSEGKWEDLKYNVINPAMMREFLSIIAVYGNSILCKQEALDSIEKVLTTHKTFHEFKASDCYDNGVIRGFCYLYATLSIQNGK